jgi:DNA ligase-1
LDDAEARVVGHVPGKGKHTGQLGALLVELPATDGQAARRFKLGTGLSDTQRRAPPAVGSWVTFNYRGLTGAGVPRFASFVRVAPEPEL